MPTATSANQKLASALLHRDVVEFIAERRPDRSWRVIARDIYEATHGLVDVTPQTLINWYQDHEASA